MKLYVKMQAMACILSRDTFDDYAFPKSNSVGRYKMLWDDTRSSHWKSTGQKYGDTLGGIKGAVEGNRFT